jgi:hypothetical protein
MPDPQPSSHEGSPPRLVIDLSRAAYSERHERGVSRHELIVLSPVQLSVRHLLESTISSRAGPTYYWEMNSQPVVGSGGIRASALPLPPRWRRTAAPLPGQGVRFLPPDIPRAPWASPARTSARSRPTRAVLAAGAAIRPFMPPCFRP